MIEEYFQKLQQGMQVLTQGPAFSSLCKLLEEARQSPRQVFFAGNGGSAANANHFATDLLFGLEKSPGPIWRVVSLSANVSLLTCLGNDVGYENVFSKQMEATGLS